MCMRVCFSQGTAWAFRLSTPELFAQPNDDASWDRPGQWVVPSATDIQALMASFVHRSAHKYLSCIGPLSKQQGLAESVNHFCLISPHNWVVRLEEWQVYWWGWRKTAINLTFLPCMLISSLCVFVCLCLGPTFFLYLFVDLVLLKYKVRFCNLIVALLQDIPILSSQSQLSVIPIFLIKLCHAFCSPTPLTLRFPSLHPVPRVLFLPLLNSHETSLWTRLGRTPQ